MIVRKDKTGKVIEFSISRRWWANGKEGDSTQLVVPENGTKCCLGFYGVACGLNKTKLKGLGTYSTFLDANNDDLNKLPEQMKWLIKKTTPIFSWQTLYDETNLAKQLMEINDNPEIGENEREATITKLFAKKGIKVTFIP